MLPPGPREPAALQTVEWIVRPTALLRRAAARYGEPFTLRTAWSDAPLVLTSDPDEIKRVYRAPPDVLEGGDSSAFLEPFVGRNSILILKGEQHLQPAQADAAAVPRRCAQALDAARSAEIANEELDTWVPGEPADQGAPAHAGDHARRDPARDLRQPRSRAARRAACAARHDRLDVAADLDVAGEGRSPYTTFLRAVERLDAADLRADRQGRRRRRDRRHAHRHARREARPARHAARRRPRDDRDRAGVGAGAARAPSHRAGHRRADRRLRQRGPAHAAGAEHHRPQGAAAVPARRATRCRPASTSRPASISRTVARTRSSRSAAACAGASAPPSPRSRCARCCAPSPRGSPLLPSGQKASGCVAAASRWRPLAAPRLSH